MINQILLVVYVAVIVILSIKLRQGTFSGFVVSDRNVMSPAVIGIAFTAAYFSAASFLGGGGYGLIAGFPWVIWATLMHVAFACLAWIMAPRILTELPRILRAMAPAATRTAVSRADARSRMSRTWRYSSCCGR